MICACKQDDKGKVTEMCGAHWHAAKSLIDGAVADHAKRFDDKLHAAETERDAALIALGRRQLQGSHHDR